MSRARKQNQPTPNLEDLRGKIPPQSIEAEHSVIGGCLLQQSVIDDVALHIRDDHFYSEHAQIIWRVIYDMHNAGMAVDAMTVGHELKARGKLDDIGGIPTIMRMIETVPHSAHSEHYARIIRETWLRRRLIEHGTQVIHDSHFDEDIASVMETTEQNLFSIVEKGDRKPVATVREVMAHAFEAILERMGQEDATKGLPSGFKNLDAMIGGLNEGMIVIAARPSNGKTSLACNIAAAVAASGKSCLFIAIEQSAEELVERMLAAEAKIDSMKLKTGDVTQEDQAALYEAQQRLAELPIIIDDDARACSITSIAAQARRAKRRSDIGLIVVDYLQLVESDNKHEPREQQVSTISRRLKMISKEIGVPVIALAQLNRDVEKRENKRPRLSDLRESGAIEQDADVVMFIHRPELYDPKDRPGEAELIVAKNRNGATGVAQLVWIAEHMRFVDRAPKSLNEVPNEF